MAKTEDGVIKIGDRFYKTVARRLADFRRDERFKGYQLHTIVLEANDDRVLVRAEIRDAEGVVLSTGHGEESRTGRINSTSALENCETGAVGRALAFLDAELAGTEIASAEERERAEQQQNEGAEVSRLIRHNEAVREHIESITAIKNFLAVDEYESAYEAIAEIAREDWESLWIAPTKGGIWTTEERGKMKSNEFNAARKAYFGEVA